MTIKKCARAEYKETLLLLNAAFGMEAHWFEKNETMCTPYEEFATDELIARHFIAVENGAVIGCAGAYPRTVVLGGGLTVNGFGVGQVCCRESERGRGVMTALMEAVEADAKKNGAVMGYLWGNMPRYRHFGYEAAGECAEFTGVVIRRLRRSVHPDTNAARAAAPDDIPALNAMYEGFRAYIKRDDKYWGKILGLKRLECFISSGAGGRAYLFAKAENKHVVEIQGDAEAAAGLLVHYADTNNRDRLDVTYPFIREGRDALFDKLLKISNWYTVGPSALAVVYDNSADAGRAGEILWENGARRAFWVPDADKV